MGRQKYFFLPLTLAAIAFMVAASVSATGCNTTHTINGPECPTNVNSAAEWRTLKNVSEGCCPPRNIDWDSLAISVACCFRAPEKCDRKISTSTALGVFQTAFIDGREMVLVPQRMRYEPPGYSPEADSLFSLIQKTRRK
jgi:hypothetical protein